MVQQFDYNPPARPENVGVVAADVYFPSTHVLQSKLEEYDGVKPGKYTIGLGQEAMAVCDSREDINSICLTVVHSIMEKYNIPWEQIGRLEVGTETLVDKSKSVKSTLMQLFEEHNCHDIEGIDTINACYGGTSALFNAINWTESSAWDGRYALVVAADIAVYDRGAARPTGGVGAVAMLVGPDAPIVIEPGLRGTHMEHAFDFYKPQMVSEYPTVDGHLSNACYIRALDNCYNRYAERFEQLSGRPFSLGGDVDFAIFHQPYAKLVQKSWARLAWNDFLVEEKNGVDKSSAEKSELFEFLHLAGTNESMDDRALAKASMSVSLASFKEKVSPSMVLGKQVGNSYCGSLYNGMASLIDAQAETGLHVGGDSNDTNAGDSDDKRVLMFSYGSGLAASMFSVRVRKPVTHIKAAIDLQARLSSRVALDPERYHEVVDNRERDYTKFDYTPSTPTDHFFPGTYVLERVDELHRRSYSRIPPNAGSMAAGNMGNINLYVSSRPSQSLATSACAQAGARGMFTSSRSHGHGQGHRVGSMGIGNNTVADPFNMSLGDVTSTTSTTSTTRSGGSSRTFSSSSLAAAVGHSPTVADPFNMGLEPAISSVARGPALGRQHVDSAKLRQRAARMTGAAGARRMHTMVRGIGGALRCLK